ncbi:hypothetical protein CKO28_04610 [Rhodovibrio sodomensis]|uniref:DUF5710 domain-containing protein n=1 Tax=Rhodovibrio sodomensis TaxID=1088 RepID=A0ABS1DAB6_9PROT|nr:DUF5710 domain-containing protein [Rhodovibrio sodomensis]MBK1667315.1 hypothetical protein [Rhodovibrio sodomensis]
MGDRNIYEMAVEHGGPGFWIHRTSWGKTCARVVAVGDLTGRPPYYGNPPVLMDVYSLEGELKDAMAPVPVPGTYKSWRQIQPPDWADRISLRPLDDPEIDAELKRHDTRKQPRGKASAMPPAPIWLNVPFERKDEAKQIGARWSRKDRCWWLPEDKTEALQKARDLGFLTDG